VAGVSMQPAIPYGARIRIVPSETGHYEVGQIIAFSTPGSARIVIHRVVHRGYSRVSSHLITRGDAILLCDPPAYKKDICGVVTEYSAGDRWQPAGETQSQRWWKAGVSAGHARLLAVCLLIHPRLAKGVALLSWKLIRALMRSKNR
jgi:hypothetical protein